MKKKDFLKYLDSLLNLACLIVGIRRAHFSAMNMVYHRYPMVSVTGFDFQDVMLKIEPFGDLYKVCQTYHMNDHETNENWIAYYSSYGSGCLVEIGGHRIAFFDFAQKRLFLEYNEKQTGNSKADIFYGNQK